jgi:hypothetical protein
LTFPWHLYTHSDQSCIRCGEPLIKLCDGDGLLEGDDGWARNCPRQRMEASMKLIGGVPASLITESDGGERNFLSIYRLRALPREDQLKLREILSDGKGWWPITQGWIYSPEEL